MLMLRRRVGESIVIGHGVRVTVTEMRGGAVRLAVEAPQETPVYRGELLEGLAPENERALLQRRLSTCPEAGLGNPLITFPYGLLGLGDHRAFLLFDADDNLRLLVARDEPSLCLLLIDPLRVDPGYPVEKAVSRYPFGSEEVAVAAVLTRHADGSAPTVNLAAPLLIGMSSRQAIQIIFDDGKLSLRAPLPQTAPAETVRL